MIGERLFPDTPPWAQRALLITLLLYLATATIYNLVNPLFEAPDETFHFFTAHALAETGRMPVVTQPWDPLMGPEPAQPPLYYLLAAAILAPFDLAEAREQVWLNPFVRLGDASALTNRNQVIHHHPGEAAYAPAAHTLRLFSTIVGAITLIGVARTARCLWPAVPGRALLAMGGLAFLPQFLFVHSYSNNDVLVIGLASIALSQLVAWQRSPTRQLSLRQAAGLGLTLGLAMLSKMAGALLLPYALTWLALGQTGPWRQRLLTLGVVAGVALTLSGWLYGRNWQLYGDPTATAPFILVAGGDRNYSLWQVLGESGGLWRSLLGVFGWFNIVPPGWFYGVWSGLALLGGLGALGQKRAAGTLRPSSLALWLAAWVLLVYLALLNFMLQTPAAQGRLLFPALLPLALGWGYGLWYGLERLTAWTPRLRPQQLSYLLLGLLGLIALYCIWGVIKPVYKLPETVDKLPDMLTTIERELSPGVELTAVDILTESVHPGEAVWLALYWRATQPPAGPPEVVITLFGRPHPTQPDGLIGKYQSYHGGGLYPASLWPPNQWIVERIPIPLMETLLTPTQGRINVALLEGENVDVGVVKVAPPTWPPPQPVVAQFGPAIGLSAASYSPARLPAGASLQVTVTWQALAAPDAFYTTFVHLGPAGQPPLAQGDSPPLQGFYPTTAWAAGESLVDHYQIDLPPDTPAGVYPLTLGLYRADASRLPVTWNGQLQPDGTYQLGYVIVDNSANSVDK